MERPKRPKFAFGGRSTRPYQPAIGRDFEVEEVEAKTRGFIVRIIVPAAVIGLAVAGLYSLITGNAAVILEVWAVVGPLLTGIVAYYFGKRSDPA